MAYAGAAVLVVGAIGVSIGRTPGLSPGADAIPSVAGTSMPVGSIPPSTIATTLPEVVATSVVASEAGAITEADLMALDGSDVDRQAMAAAEWFVVEWFTRDSSDDDPSRSFVDWASTGSIEWLSPTLATVTVTIRRLATADGGPYERVDDEAWSVDVEMTPLGWEVVGGPGQVEFSLMTDLDPDGGTRSEWVDGAGLAWSIESEAAGG